MRSKLKKTVSAIGCILMVASGAVYSQTTVRIEAEDMQLDTYQIEALDFASNGGLINLKGPGFVGTAMAPFPGVSGEYDINVVYHDENDGQAQLSVSIDSDIVDSWTLDLKSGESQPKPANRLTRQVATGYTVNTGGEIAIYGLQGNWDHANVDYIEFSMTTEVPLLARIKVLDGSVVLGDPPRAIFWQTEIDIDQDVLEVTKSAHVSLKTVNATFGHLFINGQQIQLPDTSNLDTPYSRWSTALGPTLLSIPLGYLEAGKNTVRFEAGMGNWAPDNVYDDYYFGDVELILSLR
jgi:hypothetical protein